MKIPDPIPLDRKGQYCIFCLKNSIERVYKNNLTYYKCKSCGKLAERCLVIDNSIVWWVDKENTYWHESVGVVVVNKDKKILCILRQIFPFAYSLPAGHLDTNEQPEHAARRELEEETGIKVTGTLKQLGNFDISGDSCRRGSDHHRWHLYRYHFIHGNQDIKLSDEASKAQWFSLEELQNLHPITYPLSVIIQKFKLSLVR